MKQYEPHIYLCEPSEEGGCSDSDGWDVGWYHSDASEDLCGPFDTLDEARNALRLYVDYINRETL